MPARNVTIVRGDNVLGTHSLGEGEVVTVEAVKRKDKDLGVNPEAGKANTLEDFVVTLAVPPEKPKKHSKAGTNDKAAKA
jgi:hypothetical protein